eukprot:6088834-Pleurochrysis_carterae.AAC.3
MCTLRCCEIICRKTRESSLVDYPQATTGAACRPPLAVACRRTGPPSTVGGSARGPRGPHAEVRASPPSAACPPSTGATPFPCKCRRQKPVARP